VVEVAKFWVVLPREVVLLLVVVVVVKVIFPYFPIPVPW
jgi:hypothetical protein